MKTKDTTDNFNLFLCFFLFGAIFVGATLIGATLISDDYNTNKEQSSSEIKNSVTNVIPQTNLYKDVIPNKSEDAIPYKYVIFYSKISEIKGAVKKVEYTVIINEKYKKHELNIIANHIKKTDKNNIDYIFVSFYLNNMSINGPNYAISKLTPNINSTQINYVEPVKEELVREEPVKSANSYKGTQIIGKWQMALGATTTIYKKGDNYYMRDQYSKDRFGDPERLISFRKNGCMAFRFVEDTGEVFVVMPDGLYGYMNGDFACVFSNIK
jgi:hypothetical protein